MSPVVSVLREAGLFSQIKNLLNLFYNSPKDIALTLSEIVKLVFDCIGANFSKIYLNLFATLVLCVMLEDIIAIFDALHKLRPLFLKSGNRIRYGHAHFRQAFI